MDARPRPRTDSIGFLAEIPYSLFAHPHEGHGEDHHGDEPYHFHFETLVSAVPEPISLTLAALGVVASGHKFRWD